MRCVWLGTLIALGLLLGGGGSLRFPTPAAAHPRRDFLRAPAPPATPAPPSATPTPPCAGQFSVVVAPDPPNVYDSKLEAAAALNAADVWAVGEWDTFSTNNRPLIEHWDGTAWSLVPGPALGLSSELHGIAGLAPANAWAVGSAVSSGTSPRQTLIEQWDGTAWTIVPSPNRGNGDNELNAIAALGPANLWAVGRYYEGSAEQPLILHWDGQAWTPVASPPIAPYGSLQALTAVAADDIWAAGYAGNTPNPYKTLIEHWDGHTWQVVPNPNPGTGSRAFWGVAAAGPSDVWAVGQYNSLTTSLIEHWDGVNWSVVPCPNVGMLLGLVVRAADDIWASSYGAHILHWDGSAWTQVPSSVPSSDATLRSVVAAGADLWTVGYYGTAQGVWRTLIERHSPTCAGPTTTSTATNTRTVRPTRTAGAPPTGTRPPAGTATTPATATPPPARTPTPTACLVEFTDVPPGSLFYATIRCLACAGIAGGYPCGGPGEPCPGAYFRPANNVTRGQAAKIVSSSAAFPDPIPSTRQTFADVPPGSLFWLWIERLAGRHIVGGYPCGEPGEPCIDPANRPYFRPTGAVTRGQIAQMVAGAAGWTATPTGQTFADVPPGSPFYPPVERLAARDIMTGYPCGGPFEPCDPPANRPYFRPNSPATRGQMSKIAAATFFPACAPTARADAFSLVGADPCVRPYRNASLIREYISSAPTAAAIASSQSKRYNPQQHRR